VSGKVYLALGYRSGRDVRENRKSLLANLGPANLHLPTRRTAQWLLLAAALWALPHAGRGAEHDASPRTVRVAGIVLKWLRADKEGNFRRIEPRIRAAANGGAQIVCTTECFLDGYAIADKSIPLETYRALGEPIPGGPYYERLRRLADELDIHLVAGMLEADGELRYNAAVLLGPDGQLIGKYRKQKLQHELVRNTAGTESRVLDTRFGKIGVMICADRTEAPIVGGFCARGARLLVCPSGGMFGPVRNDPIMQARSRENWVPIVFVHPAEFLVTGPDGHIVQAEVFGDRLLIDPADEGRAVDSGAIRYVDLPLPTAARLDTDHAR
jgi:N-carbamoylputrescine amidase